MVGLIAIGFSAVAAAAVVITALIAIILGGVGLLAYFAQIGSEMSDNKDDLVCALFYATSPENARQIVVDFTADIASDLTYDPADDDALFQAQAAIVANALFNDALVNLLFELDEDTDTYVGTVDCDECVLALLIHATGSADVGDALYDQVMHTDMVAYGAYWSNDGANTWRGCQTPITAPPPSFPNGNPTTLWLRVEYDHKQPLNRQGWGGVDVVQSSITKYQNRWVAPGDAVWKSFDETFDIDVNTIEPYDPIYIYIQNEKNYWQVRNIRASWVEEPIP